MQENTFIITLSKHRKIILEREKNSKYELTDEQNALINQLFILISSGLDELFYATKSNSIHSDEDFNKFLEEFQFSNPELLNVVDGWTVEIKLPLNASDKISSLKSKIRIKFAGDECEKMTVDKEKNKDASAGLYKKVERQNLYILKYLNS